MTKTIKRSLFLIFICTNSFSSFGALKTTCKTSSLSFIPYSSSIIDSKSGDLTRRTPYSESDFRRGNLNKLAMSFEGHFDIDHKLSVKSFQQNIGARYSQVRKEVLNLDDDFLNRLDSKIYIPQSQAWEGLCNQYSAASVDKKISTFLGQTNGMICGLGTVFNRDEISELFTGLFEYDGTKVFYGKRNYQDIPKKQKKLILELGNNEFNPDELNTFLHRNISNDIGIIADLDQTDEVWNHPIYSVTTCTQEVDITKDQTALKNIPLQDLRTKSGFFKQLIKILTSTKREITKLLNSKKEVESNIVEKLSYNLPFFGTSKEKYHSNLQLKKDVYNKMFFRKVDSVKNKAKNRILNLISTHPIYTQFNHLKNKDYFELKTFVYKKIIMDAIRNNEIYIGSGYKLYKKSISIMFKDYNSYAVSLKTVSADYADKLFESVDFGYYQIKDNHTGHTNSYWGNDNSSIPDFFWVPRVKKTQEIEELWEIISACQVF